MGGILFHCFTCLGWKKVTHLYEFLADIGQKELLSKNNYIIDTWRKYRYLVKAAYFKEF